MTRRRVEVAMWIAAVVLATMAGARTRSVASAVSKSASQARGDETASSPPSILRSPAAVLVAASEAIVARDPFRLERKPSDVAYSPAVESTAPPPPRPPRPALAVVGIVGGPPWEALVEGIPGRQSSVLVRRGDTVSGLRVRSITKDIVRISGMDTTWALSVRRAWQ